MSNPTAAMLIIGDEILSGRTREGNAHYLAGRLDRVGIDLKEMRVVGDDRDTIVAAVKELKAGHNHLFTSGGIGPTHDDITADCVAEALGAGIDVRSDARALLETHYERQNIELNAARLRMARIPDGAVLIENPVSAAPGFSLENVHVMAGVPTIFQTMVETLLPKLTGGQPLMSDSVHVEMAEGDIAKPLGEIAAAHPETQIGSYPYYAGGRYAANVVVRARNREDLALVMDAVREAFRGGIA
ncbi:MAG: molybdopterin-binding protein [Pseudomonadota bacterium]